MRTMRCAIGWAGVMVALLLSVGCEEDSANEAPKYVDLAGDWSGHYVSAEGQVLPLRATIGQNGSLVFIETTLSSSALAGECRLLVGRLSPEGDILLTDAHSGDTWTPGEPLTSDHVHLIDYAYGAGSALRHIDLVR